MIFVKNFLALLNENPAFLSAFNENLATNSSQTQRRTDLGQESVTIAIARPIRVFRFFLSLSVGLKKWQQRKKRNEEHMKKYQKNWHVNEYSFQYISIESQFSRYFFQQFVVIRIPMKFLD